MSKYDLTGQRFGNLVVIQKCDERKSGKVRWLCRCDCGNFATPITRRLTQGITTSCGCKRSLTTTHGLSNSHLYKIWCGMKKRCNNPNCKSFGRYGAKGIKICDAWNDNFEAFYDWAINNGYSDGLTIDRIDFHNGYSPSNCRWITMDEQAKNKGTNVLIEYNGETKILADWCRELNLDYNRVAQRRRHLIKKGVTFDASVLFKEGNLSSRKIAQYDLQGNLICVWDSLAKLMDSGNGFCKSSVCRCCNGIYKQHRGFIFRYVEDSEA